MAAPTIEECAQDQSALQDISTPLQRRKVIADDTPHPVAALAPDSPVFHDGDKSFVEGGFISGTAAMIAMKKFSSSCSRLGAAARTLQGTCSGEPAAGVSKLCITGDMLQHRCQGTK